MEGDGYKKLNGAGFLLRRFFRAVEPLFPREKISEKTSPNHVICSAVELIPFAENYRQREADQDDQSYKPKSNFIPHIVSPSEGWTA